MGREDRMLSLQRNRRQRRKQHGPRRSNAEPAVKEAVEEVVWAGRIECWACRGIEGCERGSVGSKDQMLSLRRNQRPRKHKKPLEPSP